MTTRPGSMMVILIDVDDLGGNFVCGGGGMIYEGRRTVLVILSVPGQKSNH